MTSRVLEILDRLNAIELAESELRAERVVLLAELRERQEGKCEEPEVPDFSMFKDTTRRLLTELWDAPEKMVSQEHIKEYVMEDEDADLGYLRQVINRAKQEMKDCPDFQYDIENVWGKGYKLIARKVLQSVTNSKKALKNKRKKVRKKCNTL